MLGLEAHRLRVSPASADKAVNTNPQRVGGGRILRNCTHPIYDPILAENITEAYYIFNIFLYVIDFYQNMSV